MNGWKGHIVAAVCGSVATIMIGYFVFGQQIAALERDIEHAASHVAEARESSDTNESEIDMVREQLAHIEATIHENQRLLQTLTEALIEAP